MPITIGLKRGRYRGFGGVSKMDFSIDCVVVYLGVERIRDLCRRAAEEEPVSAPGYMADCEALQLATTS